MGEVYLAEDPRIGRNIALKTVLVQEGRAQELEERKRRLLLEAIFKKRRLTGKY